MPISVDNFPVTHTIKHLLAVFKNHSLFENLNISFSSKMDIRVVNFFDTKRMCCGLEHPCDLSNMTSAKVLDFVAIAAGP